MEQAVNLQKKKNNFVEVPNEAEWEAGW